MSTIPTNEPAKVVAGDLVQWKVDFGEYPAPTWVLSYRLRNGNNKIDITAGADGTTHLVSVLGSASGQWVEGRYEYQAFVTSGTERHLVRTGRIEVLRNFATIDVHDGRTWARQALEAVEAVILGKASQDQKSYQIHGRAAEKWPPADLMKFRDLLRAEVLDEEAAEKIAAGQDNPRNIGMRFNRL